MLRRSKTLEEIPYSRIEDCDARFDSFNTSRGDYGHDFDVKVMITLKETPPRIIEIKGNPFNQRLGADLATWLMTKLAENESRLS